MLPQRLDLLADAQPVLTAVGHHAPTADDNTLRARLAGFLLGADAVRRPVGTLSGGERFRATLAALLLAEPPPQLLVMDEPTNSLDLDSVAQLVAPCGSTAARCWWPATTSSSWPRSASTAGWTCRRRSCGATPLNSVRRTATRGTVAAVGLRLPVANWSAVVLTDATPATGGMSAARDEIFTHEHR